MGSTHIVLAAFVVAASLPFSAEASAAFASARGRSPWLTRCPLPRGPVPGVPGGSRLEPRRPADLGSFDRGSFEGNRNDNVIEGNPSMGGGRRNFLFGMATTTAAAASVPRPSRAVDNPLNLKGTFWETGKLYEKPNAPSPDDESGFFNVLDQTAEALRSPALTDAISGGEYGRASRLLRGGLVSESRVRIAANALIESIPEESDDAIYRSSESFRIFLRSLDVLDAEVEAASRPFSGGGGARGRGDPRMEILTRLGEAGDALGAFLRDLRGGLGAAEGGE